MYLCAVAWVFGRSGRSACRSYPAAPHAVCVTQARAAPNRRLLAGESGISKITRFDPADMPTNFAGQIKDFNHEE